MFQITVWNSVYIDNDLRRAVERKISTKLEGLSGC